MQCSIYCSCTILLYYYYHSECQVTDSAMQYILQLNNIVILLLSFGMPSYRLCNAVYTAAVQYCYIIIIIRNAKIQTVQCSIYCSCTIFLYYYYHSECQSTDCAMQYILQQYNIVILLLSFKIPKYRLCNAVYAAAEQYCYIIIIIKMPRYRLCNAVYTAAVQYFYIIIIIRNAKVQTVQCSK